MESAKDAEGYQNYSKLTITAPYTMDQAVKAAIFNYSIYLTSSNSKLSGKLYMDNFRIVTGGKTVAAVDFDSAKAADTAALISDLSQLKKDEQGNEYYVKTLSKCAIETISLAPAGPTFQTAAELKKGKTLNLKANLKDLAKDSTVTYQSADSKIAAVDAAGNVKGMKAGKTTITVSVSQAGNTYTCQWNIKVL